MSLIPACACNMSTSFGNHLGVKDDIGFVVSIFRFRSAYLKEAALFLGSDVNMKTQQSESRCTPVNEHHKGKIVILICSNYSYLPLPHLKR